MEVLADLQVDTTGKLQELWLVEAIDDGGIILDQAIGDPSTIRYIRVECFYLSL